MTPGELGFDGPVEVIAHRGFSASAPENTIAGIEAAIEAGCDAVEFDIRTTRDGVPVLFHDETLDRTTDTSGLLAERSWAQLRGIDAGAWFGARFEGEPIPRLEDALHAIDSRIERVYVEVKGSCDAVIAERMIAVAEAGGALADSVFIAIDWSALDRLRALRPSLPIGYIVEETSHAAEAIERAAGDPSALLDFDARLLFESPELASRARDRGIEMAAWTVDEPADASRLLELGVPRITTNRVDELVAWKATL